MASLVPEKTARTEREDVIGVYSPLARSKVPRWREGDAAKPQRSGGMTASAFIPVVRFFRSHEVLGL